MAEAQVPTIYFMTDINCGAKYVHSGLVKVDKYDLTIRDLISEEISEDHFVKDIFIP